MPDLQKFRAEFPPMLQLAVPIVLAEVGWMAMGVVDTLMVGRLPNSAQAIGAVSIGSSFFYTVAIFGGGLLLGLDTLIAQAFGRKDLADGHRSLLSGAYLAICMTPVLLGLIYVAIPDLKRVGINVAVLGDAIGYLTTLSWSLFPLLLYFVFRRYLQAINVVKPITFTLVSANLVNLAGNWVLVYGHLGAPAMGIRGSAVATVISRIYMAGALLSCIIYYDRRHQVRLASATFVPNVVRMLQLLRLGLPAATQFGLEVAVFAAATAMIGRLDPPTLAGHQIALTVASFTYMVPLGISSAAAVRVGQAIGRRDRAAASRSGWAAIILGSAFMSVAAIVFLSVPQLIVRAFTPSAEVMRTGTRLLGVAAAFQLFDGLQAVATGALRGVGDTRTPMICSVVAYWVLGLPLGYFLCFRRGWGAVGLWVGLCVGLMIIGVALLAVWSRKTQMTKMPAFESAEDTV